MGSSHTNVLLSAAFITVAPNAPPAECAECAECCSRDLLPVPEVLPVLLRLLEEVRGAGTATGQRGGGPGGPGRGRGCNSTQR